MGPRPPVSGSLHCVSVPGLQFLQYGHQGYQAFKPLPFFYLVMVLRKLYHVGYFSK